MNRLIQIDKRLKVKKVDDLLEDFKTIRVNDFDEEDVENFEDEMAEAHETGQPVVPVVVDSFGGSAFGLMGMISAIENSSLPVATVVTAKAMSAGALLFCFGTEGLRFMDPNAVLMIHDLSWRIGGKVEDVKADAIHLDRLNKQLYKRTARHLGKNENYLLDLVKAHHHIDWYLGAKEAKKLGIANELRIPKFEVNVSLEINFN